MLETLQNCYGNYSSQQLLFLIYRGLPLGFIINTQFNEQTKTMYKKYAGVKR